MPTPWPMRFGAFFAPFHPVGQSPTLVVSHEWATEKRGELFGRAGQAMLNAITAHVDEKAT